MKASIALAMAAALLAACVSRGGGGAGGPVSGDLPAECYDQTRPGVLERIPC